MQSISPQECARIAQDLQIRKVQVEAVVQLLEEGNTVPFIARYRAERVGLLIEDMIRQVQTRLRFLQQLHDRKQTILKSIEHHGKMTDELRHEVLSAETMRRLDDLYLPYKPKKRGAGAASRERGLEPPALAIWHSDPAVGNLDELMAALVNPDKDLKTPDDVRNGIGQLLAEMTAESADVRAPVRAALWELGKVVAVKNEKVPEGQALEYKDYFQFNESARQIPPHRILALNRGEKEGALKLRLDFPMERIQEIALAAFAEMLLKKAGKMPPLPAPPATPPASEVAAPISGDSAAPLAETPPVDAAPVTPSSESAAPAETVPPPEAPPAQPASEPAPLVAAMEPQQPTALTGEQLSPASAFLTPHGSFLKNVLDDAVTRLLLPSLEREIRRELTDDAETHAVGVFARNLRGLLLQPPLRSKRVLAIDPGFRTGCKVAALDEYGNLLDHLVIHPFTPPPRKPRERPAKRNDAPPAATPTPTGNSVAPLVAESPGDATAVPAEPAAPVAPDAAPAAETMEAPAPSEAAASPPPVEAPAASPTEAAVTAATAEAPTPPAAPPVDKRAEAKGQLKDLIVKNQIQVVALGNGNGCRETEEIVAELIAADLPDLSYVIVNEAGASVYAISQIGREEFPEFDATLRGAISIGRRLQDPISELVKVDPHSIGVGLYQHDMSRKELRESLDGVVESCVNHVGVDVNLASVPLLRHISGLNQMVARELVDYRKQHGPFTSREQLLQLTGLGPQRWMQAVGFMRIPDAAHPLDRTWIHPESYGLAEKILAHVGCSTSDLLDPAAHEAMRGKLAAQNIDELAQAVSAGGPTTYDLVQALLTPGYDPRDELPPPIFKKGILRLEDMQPGMELKGTVLNVVDFGAFVDIGLKDSGLVHISQLANRYIKAPYEVVAVNDVVTVWVLNVDMERRRVSLTMIPPGTDRTPPQRRPRREDGARPPRGRRPDGPPREQQTQAAPDQSQSAQRHEGPPREGYGARPPRGRQYGHGRPQRQGAPAHAEREDVARKAPPPPQLPPRKPRREPPKPKLTQAALEGKVPLRTFGELSALFAAKKEKDPPPPKTAPPVEPAATPTAETPPLAEAAGAPIEASVVAAPAVEPTPSGTAENP